MKRKLSFAELEKEMNLVPLEDLETYVGGTDFPSTTMNPLPNGYCYFNTLSYLHYGNNEHASQYYDDYVAQYGTSGLNYDNDGNVIGISMSGNQMLDFMKQSQIPGYDTSYLDPDDSNMSGYISGALTGAGNKVSAVFYTFGPNGESLTHNVIITAVNNDGSYNYQDPTDGFYYQNQDIQIKWAFAQTPLYANTEMPTGQTTTEDPSYTTTGYPMYSTTTE